MRDRRLALTSASLLVALLGLPGCGANEAAQSPPSPTSPSTASPAPTSATSTAPGRVRRLEFTGTKLDGQPFDAATLAGKPVVLWFWAPWCPTCAAEAPDVLEIRTEYGDRVGLLGVAGLDKLENMQPFVDRTKTGQITHVGDPKGEIWRRFEITQQSTYVLLDASGEVSFTGILSGQELHDKVAALVG
jgi:thiol-disulfide isomerase/thioredoxin